MPESETGKVDVWIKRGEDALKKATEAMSEAWKATEDKRREAWETAKKAAEQATDALDKGIEAAKEKMDRTAAQGDAGTDTSDMPAAEAVAESPADSEIADDNVATDHGAASGNGEANQPGG